MKRPFGVAVLAIIHFLEALLFLFTGAILWLFVRADRPLERVAEK